MKTIYLILCFIIALIIPFSSVIAGSCDNLGIDNYLEDDEFTIEEAIGLIGNIKTINSSGNTVLQEIIAGTSTPNGALTTVSGNLKELLGSLALGSKVGLKLAKHEYNNAAWTASKYGIKKYINGTLLGEVISAPLALADVAILPIKLSLEHLQSGLAKTAFNNQLKMYRRAREVGLSHEDILSSTAPIGEVIEYTGDGWLLVIEELSLLGRAVAPPDVSPEELYEYAEILYNNHNSVTGACESLYDVVDEITDQLYPEIVNNRSNNVFWGPTELTFSVEGGIVNQVGVASHQWNLDNGDTSNVASPSKVFRLPGTYQITATVVLNDGTQYDLQHEIRIYPPAFEMGYPNGYGSLTRSFSTSPSPYISEYSWRIDQTSNVSHEQSFVYTFDEAEYHTASLTVTLDTGVTVDTTKNIYLGDHEIHIRTSQINWNETWVAGKTYIIEGSLHVSLGATLTIEPGAVVKVKPGNYISVRGTLIANGTTFTSESATEPWLGFSFDRPESSASRLDNCTIENASGWNEYGTTSIIRIINNSSPTIIGCQIRLGSIGTAATGIRKEKGDAIITNNTFSGFETGILLKNAHNGVGGNPLVEHNTFVNNSVGIRIFYAHNELNQPYRIRNNSFPSCQLAGIAVSGPIEVNVTWPNDGDYLVENSLSVLSGATLTIEPGTVVKVKPDNFITVFGTLIADGTTFTSESATEPWRGLAFYGPKNSASRLDNCTIENASGFNNSTTSMIIIFNSSPTIIGCQIRLGVIGTAATAIYIRGGSTALTNNNISGFETGVRIADSANVNMDFCTISNNSVNGIDVYNSSLIVSHCIITGNGQYGLYSSNTGQIVSAENNYWGHDSGPLDSSDDSTSGGWYNPNGQGDHVSDYVDYLPWSNGIPDTDADGIADYWELTFFHSLNIATRNSDYDGDGYSDYQEYLNWSQGLNDSSGNIYNPTVYNEPGGSGYNNSASSSFWTIMLPAILNSK